MAEWKLQLPFSQMQIHRWTKNLKIANIISYMHSQRKLIEYVVDGKNEYSDTQNIPNRHSKPTILEKASNKQWKVSWRSWRMYISKHNHMLSPDQRKQKPNADAEQKFRVWKSQGEDDQQLKADAEDHTDEDIKSCYSRNHKRLVLTLVAFCKITFHKAANIPWKTCRYSGFSNWGAHLAQTAVMWRCGVSRQFPTTWPPRSPVGWWQLMAQGPRLLHRNCILEIFRCGDT